MYLIIKDHKAGTVRIEEIFDFEYFSREIHYAFTGKKRPYCFNTHFKDDAEATAKSIAIKENLVYTPQIEY